METVPKATVAADSNAVANVAARVGIVVDPRKAIVAAVASSVVASAVALAATVVVALKVVIIAVVAPAP